MCRVYNKLCLISFSAVQRTMADCVLHCGRNLCIRFCILSCVRHWGGAGMGSVAVRGSTNHRYPHKWIYDRGWRIIIRLWSGQIVFKYGLIHRLSIMIRLVCTNDIRVYAYTCILRATFHLVHVHVYIAGTNAFWYRDKFIWDCHSRFHLQETDACKICWYLWNKNHYSTLK